MSSYPQPLLVWILLLPLVGAALNGLFGRRLAPRLVHGIACAAVGGAFLVAVTVFADMLRLVPARRVFTQLLFHWMPLRNLGLDAALLVDPLSILLVLIITGVGFLIHLYSSEYMEHDGGAHRYFAYLNLFVFAMLILVMGASLPMMFVGWEGVGLCSYLLIGFWFDQEANAAAGRKAFITNRVGDLGFLLGMFLIFVSVQTLDFQQITERVAIERWPLPPLVVTVATLLLFIGATGKSAQIPLYVWLPDAMAGPTPVSALIHAATMVTAGVYMIARLSALFVLSPITMGVIAAVGAATALMAATIALTQNDIKKVLAYSTVSQLGFMFVGVGVGAFAAGVFHLMTHAFFKALLFLGSGSVIHGMAHAHGAADPQDVRTMGGLRRVMPLTFRTWLVGWAAICGLPFFSGFFSKDEILWKSLSSSLGGRGLWLTISVAAMLTAFYMTRLTILAFLGRYRGAAGSHDHVHDPHWRMALPLVVLAVLAAFAGFLGIPHVFHLPNVLDHWLEPVFRFAAVKGAEQVPVVGLPIGEASAMALSVLLAAAGIGLAWLLYVRQPHLPGLLAGRLRPLHRLLEHKYWVDEAYERLLLKPLKRLSDVVLFRVIDRRVIDMVVEGSGRAARGLGSLLRATQNGDIGAYLLYMLAGAVALILLVAP